MKCNARLPFYVVRLQSLKNCIARSHLERAQNCAATTFLADAATDEVLIDPLAWGSPLLASPGTGPSACSLKDELARGTLAPPREGIHFGRRGRAKT